MLKAGGALKLDLIIKVDRVAPSQIQSSFEHPRDADSTNFQSSLFQSLTTLTVDFSSYYLIGISHVAACAHCTLSFCCATPRKMCQSSVYSDERTNASKRHSRNFLFKKICHQTGTNWAEEG